MLRLGINTVGHTGINARNRNGEVCSILDDRKTGDQASTLVASELGQVRSLNRESNLINQKDLL